MDAILELALHLYRAAQDTPLADFPDVALAMLKAVVPFCTAIWFVAEFEHGRFGLHRTHLHEEPGSVLEEFAQLNCLYPRSVAVAAASPRVAHSFHAPTLYAGAEYAPMRHYIRRYGHEHHLLIADIATTSSRGEWLSLYRPGAHAPFSEHDRQLLTSLMPHLTESLAVNRSLRLDGAMAGKRALVRIDGTILHCGAQLQSVISLEWPDWANFRLPEPLLRRLTEHGVACMARGTENIVAQPCGGLLLLTLRRTPPSARLGPREHAIARLFATGRSYKQIAQHVALSPATVRNVVQITYRKLGVNNKVQLARLFSSAE